MADLRVGTRELKNNFSKYLRRIKAGETITITERGKPVGHIVPVQTGLHERLRLLAESGLIEWNGQRLEKYVPKAVNQGSLLLSDLVGEERE
jgi:prevent-host-death family protein